MIQEAVRVRLWPIVLLFCLSAVNLGFAAQNADVTRLVRAGAQKYQAGDLNGAIAAYRQAVALQPNEVNALFGLAQALGDQGSFAEAESTYLKLLPLYEQLQRRAEQGVTYKPSMAMVWNNLAVLYCREKKFDQAGTATDRAFGYWSSPGAAPASFFVTRGMVLEGKNEPEEAVRAYQGALQKDGKNAEALLNLGVLLLNGGRADEALTVLQKGATVSKDDGLMFAALGKAFAAKERWQEAAAAYGKSVELQPTAAVWANLGDVQRRLGKLDAALESLRQAHALAPDDAAISASLGGLLRQTGRDKEALTIAEGTSGSGSGNDKAMQAFEIASTLAGQGKASEALAKVQEALAVRPDFPEATALLGSLLLQSGKTAEGRKTLEAGLAAHPENVDLHNMYGVELLSENKVKPAEEQFEQALKARPDYEDARINHAIALGLEKRGEEGAVELRAVVAANPKNVKAQANLGSILMNLRHYEEAAKAFSAAVELAPQDAELHGSLGLALQKSGRANEAQKEFALAEKLRKQATR